MSTIYRSSLNEVSAIDDTIRAYVKEIIPLIVPADADWQEEYKLEKILFSAAALNVYNRSITKLQDEFNKVVQNSGRNINISNYSFNVELERTKVWCALERTNPNFFSDGIILKRPINTRYMKRTTWREENRMEQYPNQRRLVREYTRRTFKKISTERFFKEGNFLPETDAAFAMRDFFANSGNLGLINLESSEYKDLLETVETLRKELIEKTYNLNSLNQTGELPDIYSFSPDRTEYKDYLYRIGCENLRSFTGMCLATAHANNISINLQRKEDRKLDKKEFLRLSKVVIDIFDKEFSSLPENEEEHEKIMDELYKKVSNYLATIPGARLNHPYEYKTLIKGLYKKYMKQLERGTLPVRLSYMPEDKALYEDIIDNARNVQRYERANGVQTENISAAIMGSMVAAMAITAGVISALDGNFALPVAEATIGLSGYILHKININRRLNMDIEKRLSIKHMTINTARKLYNDPSQEAPSSFDKEERIRRTERNASLYRRLEYLELPEEELEILTEDENKKVEAPKPRERHRRVDRYKNTYEK